MTYIFYARESLRRGYVIRRLTDPFIAQKCMTTGFCGYPATCTIILEETHSGSKECASYMACGVRLKKKSFYGKHGKDQALGQKKKEGLGIKPVMSGENLEGREEIAGKSTKDEEQLPEM